MLEELNELSGQGLFTFSPSSLIAGVVFGILGWWLYRQGKLRETYQLKIIGILMMVYPMFTSTPAGDWGPGLALCFAAYYFW